MPRRRDDLLSFNPAVPVVARRAFQGAGRHWQVGDDFPWKRLSVDQRRVRQLFESGKLMHKDMGAPVEAAPKPVAAPEPAPAPVAAPEPDDGLDDMKMPELRAIAEEEGAPTKLSKKDQVEAIRENRR